MQRVTFAQIAADAGLWQDLVGDLQRGGVLVLPTDTLYGFAVDGDSRSGVEAVYRLKSRESRKPLIVLIDSAEKLSRLGIAVSPRVREFLERFWPGPLTGVFPFVGSAGLSAFTHATIGVRVPDHPELRAFLASYPGFLLTTSANISGQAPVFSVDELPVKFPVGVAGMIDGGNLPLSEPSTVADMGCWPPRVLRPGKAKW